MPNPRTPRSWPNVPLDEHLNGTSHVKVECGAPLANGRCGYQVIMSTRMLYEKAPGAVTCADFMRRLRCRRGHKGWAVITAAGR